MNVSGDAGADSAAHLQEQDDRMTCSCPLSAVMLHRQSFVSPRQEVARVVSGHLIPRATPSPRRDLPVSFHARCFTCHWGLFSHRAVAEAVDAPRIAARIAARINTGGSSQHQPSKM